jgi:predicted nucleic acid-binding protein
VDTPNVFAAADLVTMIETVKGCRDIVDDQFLALAMNGHAEAIVPGDDDLLALDTFLGNPIISPAVFGRAEVV